MSLQTHQKEDRRSENQQAAAGGEDALLNTGLSVAVALAGTFMALVNVKDGNVNQAMQDAQARRIDEWAYYQAKSIKGHLAEATLEQLKGMRFMASGAAEEARAGLDQKVAEYQERVTKYEREKTQVKQKAEAWQAKYDALNTLDDQFDLSEALLSLGIALAGVSGLVKRRSLFLVAVVFMTGGIVMGLAGFMGWPLRIPWLSQWLS